MRRCHGVGVRLWRSLESNLPDWIHSRKQDRSRLSPCESFTLIAGIPQNISEEVAEGDWRSVPGGQLQ